MAEKKNKNIILVILSEKDFDVDDLNLRASPYPVFLLSKAKNLQPAPYGLKGECIAENAYKIEEGTLRINKKRILLTYEPPKTTRFHYAVLVGMQVRNFKIRTSYYYMSGTKKGDTIDWDKRQGQVFACSYITHQLKL